MQKRKTYTVFAILVLTLTVICAYTHAQPSSEQIASAIEDPVHIPDSNLRSAIHNALGLDSPMITQADMLRLEALPVERRGITDLMV